MGSNLIISVLGTMLLWFGWFGFNAGSTLAFDGQVPGILLNTLMAGVAGILGAGTIRAIQTNNIDIEALINGCLAGLVCDYCLLQHGRHSHGYSHRRNWRSRHALRRVLA